MIHKKFLMPGLLLLATTPLLCQIWSGAHYNEGASPQYQAALDMLAQHSFSGNEKILDVGCGDGKVTAVMAKQFCKNGIVIGIDSAPDMISFAQKKNSHDNVSFQLMDATAISFDTEFDLVVSFFCLHWVQDLEKALNGIIKSLKKGGKALIVANCLTSIQTPYRKAIQETKEQHEWRTYFTEFKQTWFFKTAPEFAGLLSKVGFKIIFADAISKEYIFPGRGAFLNWLNATPGNQNTIPLFLVDSFHNALIDNYLNYVPMKGDGSIPFARPLFWAIVEKQ